jgi:hypothetical protein
MWEKRAKEARQSGQHLEEMNRMLRELNDRVYAYQKSKVKVPVPETRVKESERGIIQKKKKRMTKRRETLRRTNDRNLPKIIIVQYNRIMPQIQQTINENEARFNFNGQGVSLPSQAATSSNFCLGKRDLNCEDENEPNAEPNEEPNDALNPAPAPAPSDLPPADSVCVGTGIEDGDVAELGLDGGCDRVLFVLVSKVNAPCPNPNPEINLRGSGLPTG